MTIIVRFDGGCVPNPGRGYGSYDISCDELGIHLRQLRMQFGWCTNNSAEYLAMIRGLQELSEVLIRSDLMGLPKGEIISDSQLVVHQMNKRWRCQAWRIGQMRNQALELCGALFSAWNIKWVRRWSNVSVFGH